MRRIVGWYKLGLSPEEIALEYPHLTLAQVHAALTYYRANREEIEAISSGQIWWARFRELLPGATAPAIPTNRLRDPVPTMRLPRPPRRCRLSTFGMAPGTGAKAWTQHGCGNVFRHLGRVRGGSRSSQPLRTSRTALGMLSPRACTTFRMRAKLALSYSVAS